MSGTHHPTTPQDTQVVELYPPVDDDGWHASQVRDWVSVCPELSDSAIRMYLILRALVIDKHGPVRKLTLWELCHLLPSKQMTPGEKPSPSSVSRVRGLLRQLTMIGLVTTPEGHRLTTSSRALASGRGLRMRINLMPVTTYRGPRNVFAALEDIRGAAEESARKARKRELDLAAEKRAKRAQEGAGQISDPLGQISDPLGQISDPLGQISDPLGQISDPHSGPGLQDREPPLSPSAQSFRSDADALPNAVGQGAGGFASAGAHEGAADETGGGPDGGSAASGTIPPQQQKRRSPRPRTVPTRERQMPPGAEDVIAAIPPEVCRPGTTPWVGLRRAIADLLTGNPGAGIPGRMPSQVIERMSRCWYGGRGPERSAPGYAPATTDPGDQPIRNRSSWLAAAILHQECPDPKCEDGVIITTGRECADCAERRHEMAAARQAVVAAEARRAAEQAELRARDTEARAALWRGILDDAYAEDERWERTAAERAGRQARERAEGERLKAQIAEENPELVAAYAARKAT